jgi:hypothetical protein
VIFAAVPTCRLAGAPDRLTNIGGGAAVIVIVAGADFLVGSATDVAVTVTVFPLGTLLGAV